MSTENEVKEQLKEMSNINDKVLDLIKKYNRIAKQGNHETRLAVLTSTAYYDEEEGGKPADLDQYLSDYYGRRGLHATAPDAEAWFPSSFCYDY